MVHMECLYIQAKIIRLKNRLKKNIQTFECKNRKDVFPLIYYNVEYLIYKNIFMTFPICIFPYTTYSVHF